MHARSLYMILMLLLAGMGTSAQFGDVLALRTVPDQVVDSLQKTKSFAYANDGSIIEEEKATATQPDQVYNFFRKKSVRTVSWILLIGFFLFIIYRIIVVNNLVSVFSQKKLPEEDETADIDITDESLDDKINRAVNEGNYRSAIRFLYLKGLRLLNDRGWIRYHAQATNHEYVQQLSHYPVAGDFRFLTQVYDYVWYGEFPVNEEQFTRLQSHFNRFYQAVR